MRFLTSSSWIAAHSQTLRLLALSLSYAASLLIFQQGLLVKRQVLPQRSACCSSDSVVAFNTKHKHCWLPPRFNKTILLIVDALRYDFIFPYDNYKGRLHPLPNSRYHRQMTKVAQLMREQPANSALFPFIADAPTTTFQRIKALVTGSVPAFIEAGENFGGTEISEDNIVDQLVAKGGNATLLGDETWIQLLPGRFHRHFEEPSFDIKDLDRVDDTVIAHIFHELARPDWTLLVAHCLGVDHAGHRYGPDHPEMSRKLRQMDSLIWELTRRLSEDTILLVLGDHGMTASGDHGGDSHQELVSALFAYTRRPGGFDAPAENNDGTSSAAEKGNDGGGGTREGGEKPVKAVKQVDLVPTLAFLLDLPIPYSNIGQFIFPLFSGNLLQEIRLNSVQMLRYAQEYAKHKPELREQLRQVVREHESSLNDFEANRQTIQALQSLIRRSLDSQFQWTVCFLGLLSLLDALMFNCYLLAAGPDECLSICLWVFRSALLLLQLSLIFAQQPSTDQVLFSVASLLLSLSYQVPACLAKLVRSSQSAANIHNNLLSLLVIGGGQLVLAILPFSNSFIIYEADVLRFAIQSLVLIVTARLIHLITSIWQMPQQLSDMLMRSVFILVFLRVMRPFESCREEQVECIDYKSAESQLFLHCLLVSFGCAYLQLEYFWPATGDDGHNANDNGVHHLTTRAFVWPMTALLCLHWLFELSAQSMQAGRLVEDEKRSAAIASTVATLELCSRVLGQLIFGTLILHHLALRWRRNDETGGNSDDNKTKEASITTVCRRRRNGRLQAQFQALSVPLMMLVGPAQAWKLALLLTMFPMAEQLFCIEKVWTRAWLLHLLGAYAFFGTGNQQTLSSIPWRAAFVALPGNFPYKWLPALLVLSSMFAGGVVASLMVLRDETGGMAPLYFMLFGGLKVFGCSAASLLHHRHLMFYKVFAPKFVFESVEFLFTCAFIVVWVCLFRRTGRHTVLDK